MDFLVAATDSRKNPIGLFHHMIYFEYYRKPVNQHGGSCVNLYCVAMTYGRLRSGHLTHEKCLYIYFLLAGRCPTLGQDTPNRNRNIACVWERGNMDSKSRVMMSLGTGYRHCDVNFKRFCLEFSALVVNNIKMKKSNIIMTIFFRFYCKL